MPRRFAFPLILLAACPVAVTAQTLTSATAQTPTSAPQTVAAPPASDPDTPPAQPTKPHGNSITLSAQQPFTFSQTSGTSPGADQARQLRNAPLPDPNTIKKPDTSQHDPSTGADTSPFGSAYSYANPLYGPQGSGSVQNAASKSAGSPPAQGLQLVVFQWGYPPRPMPKVPGDDLTAAPPPVAVIDFAVQADDQPVLDAKSLATIGRAVQAYGRAALTKITIERPASAPNCCTQFPDLIRAALIGSGLGPDHLLSGHQVRVVMTTLPVSKQ